MTSNLPIEPILPAVVSSLGSAGSAVLQAPPGAGKTTRVPPALLAAPWRNDGTIVVLEPRRLAARASARRMAQMLGEEVGNTVGYRVRHDSRVGPATRIEVVTEGLYLRRLQDDPGLDGVAAVLFDEFHERTLDGALALALTLDARAALRPDLRILVMSATLDPAPVAQLLGGAPILVSTGRSFPVATFYTPPPDARRLEDAVAAVVRRALAEESGDLLVFLPGAGEIRRVQARLQSDGPPAGIDLVPLYGDLGHDQQDRALQPAAGGRRKVVLATAIAETSLTIEGVRGVIDAGLMRVPRFDPSSGMTRLETVRVSQASADQRRGRAGRLAPGVCWRLWPEAEHKALLPFTPAEMLAADLAPLALELALWGVNDPAGLAWLDPPPAAALAQARDLLMRLGALDRAGRITPHGRAMAGFGTHPRLAHMILEGHRTGRGALACLVAALLGERDPIKGGGPHGRDADLAGRMALLLARGAGRREAAAGAAIDRAVLERITESARQWQRQLGVRQPPADLSGLGGLVALAYPDRVALRRPGGQGQYRLANGRGAALDPADPLAREDWLAVAALDGDRTEGRIFLAAPLNGVELETLFADRIETVAEVVWDGRAQAVAARRRRRFGELVIEEQPLADPDPALVAKALLTGLRGLGLAALPWTEDLQRWRRRVAFVRTVEGVEPGWPDLGDAALSDRLEDWLLPFLPGKTRLAQIRSSDLATALQALLPWPLPQRLDQLAPTHWTVPTGSRIPIDYDHDGGPALSVRLQEMFGAVDTPRIADGRVPLLLQLLSPAQRPVQLTRDLAGFWRGAYRAVKADLKGRYPKHFWPDDPLTAEPTRRTKRASQGER